MTTYTVTSAVRALLKRLLNHTTCTYHITPTQLYLNSGGAIAACEPGTPDSAIVVTLTDQAHTRGTWQQASSDILNADQLTITPTTGVTIHENGHASPNRSTILTGAPGVLAALCTSGDGELVLTSDTATNRSAMRMLAASAGRSGDLPLFESLRLVRGEHSLTGWSSNRYLATRAELIPTGRPTLTVGRDGGIATIPGVLLREMGRRKNWTLTVTDRHAALALGDLGVTITTSHVTDARYPPLRALFAVATDSTITTTVAALRHGVDSLDVAGPDHPVHLGAQGALSSSTADPITLHADHIHTGAHPTVALNADLIRTQLKAASPTTTLTIEWGKPRHPVRFIYENGITNVIQPVNPPAQQ